MDESQVLADRMVDQLLSGDRLMAVLDQARVGLRELGVAGPAGPADYGWAEWSARAARDAGAVKGRVIRVTGWEVQSWSRLRDGSPLRDYLGAPVLSERDVEAMTGPQEWHPEGLDYQAARDVALYVNGEHYHTPPGLERGQ